MAIDIKKSHKGLFTKKAKAHDMGVQEFAKKVLANKDNYPTSTVKQAVFAKNARSFKHQKGGTIPVPLALDKYINWYNPNNVPVSDNTTNRVLITDAKGKPKVVTTGQGPKLGLDYGDYKLLLAEDLEEYKNNKSIRELDRRKAKIAKSDAANAKNPLSREALTNTAAGEKLRVFPDNTEGFKAFFDDYINPAKMIGDMADNLSASFGEDGTAGQKALAIAAPLTFGALAGVGATNTKQFVKNVLGLPESKRNLLFELGTIKRGLSPSFQKQAKESLETGNKWMRDWMNDPETRKIVKDQFASEKRMSTMLANRENKFTEGIRERLKGKVPDEQIDEMYPLVKKDHFLDEKWKRLDEMIKSGNWQDAVYQSRKNRMQKLFKPNELNTDVWGLSGYGVDVALDPTIRQAVVNKYAIGNDLASTTIHELTHNVTQGSWGLPNSIAQKMDNIFGNNLILGKPAKNQVYSKYLQEPAEVYARIMETRYANGMKPGQKLSLDEANKIIEAGISGKYKGIDPRFFKMISNRKGFKELMNKLPVVGAAAAVGAGAAQSKQSGGLIDVMGYKDNSPFRFNPYNVINSGNITMDGVSTPLLAVNNGEVHYLPPNSGNYKFKGKKTLEIPILETGGDLALKELELAKRRGQLDEYQNIVPINNYAATPAPSQINPILAENPIVTQPNGDIKTQILPSEVPSPKPANLGIASDPFTSPIQAPQRVTDEVNRVNTLARQNTTSAPRRSILGSIGSNMLQTIVPAQQLLYGISENYNARKQIELAQQRMVDAQFNPSFQYVENDYGYKKGGTVSAAKAREILHDGTVHGHKLTDKQRRFFGAMANKKMQDGGEFDAYDFLFGEDDQQPQDQQVVEGTVEAQPGQIDGFQLAQDEQDQLALDEAMSFNPRTSRRQELIDQDEIELGRERNYGTPSNINASKNVMQTAVDYRNYAMSLGLSKSEASGLIGNAYAESDFRPTLKGTADDKGSVGLFQPHSERLTALKNYAASQGKDWRDPYVQIEQAVRELNTTHKKARGNYQSGTDAARAIMNHFEKPAEWAKKQSFGKRAGMAERLMQYEQGGTYDLSQEEIDRLISLGYKIEF